MPNTYEINTEMLVTLRKSKGYSQEKMADLLITDRSGYGKIERGETELTLRVAYKLAEILDAKIADFVYLPEPGKKTRGLNEEIKLLLEKAMGLLPPPLMINIVSLFLFDG